MKRAIEFFPLAGGHGRGERKIKNYFDGVAISCAARRGFVGFPESVRIVPILQDASPLFPFVAARHAWLPYWLMVNGKFRESGLHIKGGGRIGFLPFPFVFLCGACASLLAA